jgi:hypothetical protein
MTDREGDIKEEKEEAEENEYQTEIDEGEQNLDENADIAVEEEEGHVADEKEPKEEVDADLHIEQRIYPNEIKDLIVRPEKRMTSNLLNKNELALVLSAMADQISRFGIDDRKANSTNALDIAKDLLIQRQCPYIIRRLIAETDTERTYEEWIVNEMAFDL